MAEILSKSWLAHEGNSSEKEGEASPGRIKWDTECDIRMPRSDGMVLEPNKWPNRRAIQIGMSGPLSQFYVHSVLSIEDVTELSLKVKEAHQAMRDGKGDAIFQSILDELSRERPYVPRCTDAVLRRLGMMAPPVEPVNE
jgi:hypothetical protein